MISTASAASAASARSTFGKAASLFKKTANMPVEATRSMARRSYQAGAAVVNGTSYAVVTAGKGVGSTVATGGKALVGGTSYMVKGSSRVIVGGTSAVVKGGSFVVKGSSRALVGGTTAVVKGSSRALVGGTTALVGGTSAVVKGSSKALVRTGRATFRRKSQSGDWKSPSQNQWDAVRESLDSILQPESAAYQALSREQRKSLQKVKKMVLHQGPNAMGGGGLLSSPLKSHPVACVPMDLLEMEKRNQQQMRRRPSTASSFGNASISGLQQDAASVQSEASYLLQEYGGITMQNPMSLLQSNPSEESEYDDFQDFLETASTSDISFSESRDDPRHMETIVGRLSISSAAVDANSIRVALLTPTLDDPLLVGNGEQNAAGAASMRGEDTKDLATKPTTKVISPSLVKETQASGHSKKIKKTKPSLPPPVVTITLNKSRAELRDPVYTTTVPIEFHQIDGIDKQRAVYDMLRWEKIADWDYDIFDLDRYTGGNALLFMGWAILGAPYSQYAMAHACGLVTEEEVFLGYPFVDNLSIPPQKLIQYLRVIQQDYHAENPYHNAIHAADVTQTVHTMIQMALQTTTILTVSDSGSDAQQEILPGFFVRCCPNHLKLFSTLLAAVCHDVDHPGRSNAFQTKLRTEVAIIYNDKSVLENWHIAHAFARMIGLDLLNSECFYTKDYTIGGVRTQNQQDCECNLLCNASAEDFAKIRNMMIEAILQTDMTKHFALVAEVKNMLIQIEEEEKSGSMQHDDERTWTLLTFMLHQADISGQAKTDPLFLSWSDRVQQEFFQQGDQEAVLGLLPISPYCDRKTTHQAMAQTGFVEFVVQPSYDVLADYIPAMQQVVLPLIQENLDFWYDASGKTKEVDKEDKQEEEVELKETLLEEVEEED